MLIDSYMLLDAPLSDDTERFPRLAANAAPAAICCFFDIAGGISKLCRARNANPVYQAPACFRHSK